MCKCLQWIVPWFTDFNLIHAGQITVADGAVLNRETMPSHTLVLTATDQGQDMRSTSIELRVALIDVNDNFPMFEEDPYTGSVREVSINIYNPVRNIWDPAHSKMSIECILQNSPEGVSVLTVVAIDIDNDDIIYRIESG